MAAGYIGESGLTIAGKDAGNDTDEHRCNEQQGNALFYENACLQRNSFPFTRCLRRKSPLRHLFDSIDGVGT